MRTLAVVSGAAPRPSTSAGPERARWFLAHLAALGRLDLVLVHDVRSTIDDRRARRRCTVAGVPVDRCLEVAAPRQRRSGLLRDVHIHRSGDPGRAEHRSAAERLIEAFVAGVPEPYELAWSADLAALARATRARRALPAVVDIDRGTPLSGTRASRAARSWAAAAHLVTVPDAEVRERLAVPGALVLASDDDDEGGDHGAVFASRVLAVVAANRAYRPARTA